MSAQEPSEETKDPKPMQSKIKAPTPTAIKPLVKEQPKEIKDQKAAKPSKEPKETKESKGFKLLNTGDFDDPIS
jgi:hypothetical protein